MRSETSDRPVSLVAVEDMLRKCGYHDLVPLLASVPTFAPATHGGLTIPEHYEGQSTMNWVTLLLGHNPLLGAIYDYADAFAKGYSSVRIDEQRNRLIAEADKLAAPPAPVAPKSVEEMADAIGAVRCHCGTGWLTQGDGCVQDDRVAELYAEHTAPTKPPREMPAPEWTGPDRWQVWSADASDDQPTAPADDGYTPIGAWKLVGVGPTNLRANGGPEDMDTVRVWRRPLRRVQA